MFLWDKKEDLERALKSFCWKSHWERRFETTGLHLSVTSGVLLIEDHTQHTCAVLVFKM